MADQWSQRLQAHRVNTRLDEVLALVQKTVSDPELSESTVAYLRRAESVISQFKSRLSRTDPRLLPPGPLDNAATYLEQTQAEIQSFVSDKSEAHLSNVDTSIDNLAASISTLPPLTTKNGNQAAREAAKMYADGLPELEAAARQRLADLRTQIDQASASVSELSQKLTELRETAQTTATEITARAQATTNEIIADRDAKLAELRTEIDSQKGRLDEAIALMQNNFTQSQAHSLETFNRAEQERQSAFTQKTDTLVAQQEARLKEIGEQVTASRDKLLGYERDAARIVGTAAAAEVAGGYNTEAIEQRKQADAWRYAAFVVVIILAAGSVVVSILGLPKESTSEILTFSIPRVAVASALVGVFTYAARESSKHRDRERRAKQRALELSSFRPFLVELPEAEQHEAIRTAVSRYFKGADADPGQIPEPKTD